MLALYRRALALRRELQTAEEMEWVSTGREDVLRFRRPGGWEVITNFGTEAWDLGKAQVVLSSRPVADGMLPGETTVWVKS